MARMFLRDFSVPNKLDRSCAVTINKNILDGHWHVVRQKGKRTKLVSFFDSGYGDRGAVVILPQEDYDNL